MSIISPPLPSDAASSSVSRRTLLGASALAVPAVTLMSAAPAFAATSQSQLTLTSANGTLPAAGATVLTVTVKDSSGVPQAGAAVTVTGPAGASFTAGSVTVSGTITGTTDGAGVFSPTVDLLTPWAKPGSTAVLTALSGANAVSQPFTVLGSNMYQRSTSFTQSALVFPARVVSTAVGFGGTSVVVLADGTVWTRGGNGPAGNAALLGDGSTQARPSTWGKVPGLSTAVEVVAGEGSIGFFLVRLSNGEVWGWGWNSYGNLGDGSSSIRSTPVRMLGVDDAVGLAAGMGTSFVLRQGGTLMAVGSNTTGAAGVGDGSGNQVPLTAVVHGTDVVSVAGRFQGGLFAKADGSVWSWGSGSQGYIGDGQTSDRIAPVELTALPGNVVSVTTGRGSNDWISASIFAVTGDGNVWGWGRNDTGQLGNSSGQSRSTPIQVNGATNVTQVSVSRSVLALTTAGSVLAWGNTELSGIGQTSTPTAIPSTRRIIRLTTNTAYAPYENNGYLIVGEETIAVDVADAVVQAGAASTVTASVTSAGSPQAGTTVSFSATAGAVMAATGGTTSGTGTLQTTVTPDAWTRPGATVAVTASTDFGNARDTFTVLGSNMYEKNASYIQSARELPAPVAQIASGWQGATAAVLADGSVWTRGGNAMLLGDGSAAGRSTWGQVPGLSKAVEIVAGSGWIGRFHVRLSNGQVWGWGNNQGAENDGILGDGTTVERATPVRMQGIDDAVQLAASNGTVFVLRADGRLFARGWVDTPSMGGVGPVSGTTIPLTQVVNGTDVKFVCGRMLGGYLVKNDGSVWAWGRGANGFIGDGQTQDRLVPVQVTGLPGNIVSVSSGLGGVDWYTTTVFAITADGDVWGWGRNDNGQLGNSSGQNSAVPIKVAGASDVSQILVTRSVTALRKDGSVLVWGATELSAVGTTATPTAIPLPRRITRLTTNAYIPYNNDSFLITEY